MGNSFLRAIKSNCKTKDNMRPKLKFVRQLIIQLTKNRCGDKSGLDCRSFLMKEVKSKLQKNFVGAIINITTISQTDRYVRNLNDKDEKFDCTIETDGAPKSLLHLDMSDAEILRDSFKDNEEYITGSYYTDESKNEGENDRSVSASNPMITWN